MQRLKMFEQANAGYCAFFNSARHAEYDFLSNFHEHPVETEYGTFRCSEGFYHFLKFAHLNDAALNECLMFASGQQAWDISRKPELRDKIVPGWDRVASMRKVLKCKFADETLKQKLLETGGCYLVENSPNGHDAFWSDNGNGSGENKMGTLLMELRLELGGAGIVPRPAQLELLYSQQREQHTKTQHDIHPDQPGAGAKTDSAPVTSPRLN